MFELKSLCSILFFKVISPNICLRSNLICWFLLDLQVLAIYRFLLNGNLVLSSSVFDSGLQLNKFDGLLDVNLVLSSSVFYSGLQLNMFYCLVCCYVVGF